MKRLLFIFSLSTAIGCASQPGSTTKPIASSATTEPSGPPEAFLALDEIPSRPKLAELKPTTAPSTESSLEAIELYARARGALVDNQRFNAISLLERAVDADPDSFEIRFDLAKAYAGAGTKSAQAIASFEEAAKIKPDDIAVQTELGRQYLGTGSADAALVHLRLAVQTSDYATDDEAAATADSLLALALQQRGYDRAAIDQYESLLRRLSLNTLAIRGNAELLYVANHPESIYLKVGQLYEKHKQFEMALRAYRSVAERNPNAFENQARVINMLMSLNQFDEAKKASLDLVSRFRASGESLALLKSVYKQAGKEQDVIGELRKLVNAKPGDHTMLYALAETLAGFDRRDEAAKLLSEAMAREPKSLEIFRKLFALYESRDQTEPAAQVWIKYLADHADSITELQPLWDKLTRTSRRNALRLTELQKLRVDPNGEGCKLYLVSRQAILWHRMVLARTSLEQACKHRPIFPPAFRAHLNDIWTRQEWDKARKQLESDALVKIVSDSGDPAFAAELRGIQLLNDDNASAAIDAFAEATRLGDPSPDLQLTYALAVRQQGNEQRFEQLVWKLISDRPTYEDGYKVLFRHYGAKKSESQKRKVVDIWRREDPTNFHARLAQVDLMLGAGPGRVSVDAVESLLLEIFRENPDQFEVITALQNFYLETGRLNEWISRLETESKQNPTNRVAVESLVEIYLAQKKLPDAIRVLDGVRSAIGDDPDLLYSLAGLYQNIEQPLTTEEILARVIEISPQHAAANNDLGYTWADQGKDLDKAESMIRIAVDAEPDNESFLDSLGWVLYKRARFGEARGFFERAVAPVTFPDPVVLDHLGDTLYRLNDAGLAKKRWNDAVTGITQLDERGVMRDELRKLRLTLIGKIKQADQGRPVIVAPIAEQTGKREQAKN